MILITFNNRKILVVAFAALTALVSGLAQNTSAQSDGRMTNDRDYTALDALRRQVIRAVG